MFSEVEEVGEPRAHLGEALGRDLSGDAGDAVAGECAGLFGHDPGGTVEAARSVDADVVRPTAVRCGDGQCDDEGRDSVEVST